MCHIRQDASAGKSAILGMMIEDKVKVIGKIKYLSLIVF